MCSQQLQLQSFKLQAGTLTVQVAVQNIAYYKKVSVLYSSKDADCSFQEQINQTHETWIGQIPNYPTTSPFSLRYILNQKEYLDTGPSGSGYTIGKIVTVTTSLPADRPNPTPTSPSVPASSYVLLQTFDWAALTNGRANHFNYLNSQIQQYHQAGFDGLWLPPISESVDMQGYFPTKWYKLVNEYALKSINKQLRGLGMISLVDFVVNHRGGVAVDPCTGKYTQFESPRNFYNNISDGKLGRRFFRRRMHKPKCFCLSKSMWLWWS